MGSTLNRKNVLLNSTLQGLIPTETGAAKILEILKRKAKISSIPLTLKAPSKNCSRRHFNFLLLSFEENKA